jgi:hypothetical protein
VEGFEPKVLQGMREHLSRRAFRLLVIEMNDYTLNLAGTTPAALRELLAQHHYVSLGETPAGRQWRRDRVGNDFFVPA